MTDAHRHPEQVAPDVLGCTLVCRGTAVVITEVEAYHQDEPAAHSFGGVPTERTKHLFGPAGTLYVYFTYGMHWCANLVTGPDGSGEAVLLRAGEPIVGVELMHERRGRTTDTANGPAKLVSALGIQPSDNGRAFLHPDLTLEEALASAEGPVLIRDPDAARMAGIDLPINPADIVVGPRIGISKAVDLPWRFGIRGAQSLSKPFR